MRVIECNVCGETVSAATDEELVERLGDHMRTEHDREVDEAEVESLVEDEAYEAMDS